MALFADLCSIAASKFDQEAMGLELINRPLGFQLAASFLNKCLGQLGYQQRLKWLMQLKAIFEG